MEGKQSNELAWLGLYSVICCTYAQLLHGWSVFKSSVLVRA